MLAVNCSLLYIPPEKCLYCKNKACLRYIIVLCAMFHSCEFFLNCIVGYREGVFFVCSGVETIHELADFFQ
jgi:hypothetical protein